MNQNFDPNLSSEALLLVYTSLVGQSVCNNTHIMLERWEKMEKERNRKRMKERKRDIYR